jgi:hypothetical protein
MKPRGGKQAGASRLACRQCFQSRDLTTGDVYCPHFNVLQTWVRGTRVVVANVRNRAQALKVLESLRKQMRKEEPDEIVWTCCTLKFRGDGGS